MTRATKALALVAATLALTGPTLSAAPPPQRAFVAGSFGLELESVFVGFVSRVEGGNVVGEVAKLAGEQFFVRKQLANVGVRDIVLEFGAGMNPALYNWMKAALERKAGPKSGAILTVDFKGEVRSRLEFHDEHITQITIPAADATSKDPLRFGIRLTPEHTTLAPGSGKPAAAPLSKQKLALASSFRLTIDGLDMSRASNVESLTIDLPMRRDDVGESRDYAKGPAPIDFPNVFVTLAASHAESVYGWLEDFVIQGNNSDESEKNGSLEFLSPNLSTTLFELTFKQLGIFEIAPVPTTNTDSIARVLIAMYCERIEFSHAGQPN